MCIRDRLSMKGTFSLVTGLPLMVCKSIAKASKVRILHLPPRAERAPDLRKRGRRSFSHTWRGYRNDPVLGVIGLWGRRPVTCENVEREGAGSTSAGNAPVN